MNSLFPKEKIVFDLPDAEIEYYPNLFSAEKSNELFLKLKNEIPWQQDNITVFGQTYPQPRRQGFFRAIPPKSLIIATSPVEKTSLHSHAINHTPAATAPQNRALRPQSQSPSPPSVVPMI